MENSEGSYVFTQRAIESLTMDTSEGSYVFTPSLVSMVKLSIAL
jgi:hypothetical protein